MTMRRVLGARVADLSAEEFEQLRAGRADVLLDVGAGDGKHALAVARARPDALVVALDANRDNMRRAATRAAAKPARGGLPNAVFVWAAAESLPEEFDGAVNEIHVLMPWGSLLRGMLGADPVILRNLRRVAARGASMLVTLNLHAWRPPVPEVDGVPEPDPSSAATLLAGVYRAAGWKLTGAAYLTPEQVEALATSWTRRLGSSRQHLDVLAINAVALPE